MSTAKRKRQKEGKKLRQEMIASVERRREMSRRFVWLAIFMAVAVGIMYFVGGGNDSKKKALPADCPKIDGSSTRKAEFSTKPSMCIDETKTYKATMETDAGTIEIDLDAKKAPKTVNNFVYLSRYHFYDALTFHRVIPDFMIQGGDPKGDGTGGPGYQFEDELPASKDEYKAGSLAMANSGPNSNGSQFFVISSDSGGQQLEAKYSLFGGVTKGMDVVAKITADGGTSQGNGTDIKVKHKINKVTITES